MLFGITGCLLKVVPIRANFSYWVIILAATITNRFVIRTTQRLYAQRGRGLHRTLIVGTGSNAKMAFDDLMRNKILGMEVIGYIQVNGNDPDAESGIYPEDVIGQLSDIDRLLPSIKSRMSWWQ